jgi:hypothetical protein
MWTSAFDDMNEIDRDHHASLTIDQKLKVAQIKALLAIGQELEQIHYNGVGTEQRQKR